MRPATLLPHWAAWHGQLIRATLFSLCSMLYLVSFLFPFFSIVTPELHTERAIYLTSRLDLYEKILDSYDYIAIAIPEIHHRQLSGITAF